MVCRVVIVDDHPIVRAGLASLIDSESDLSVCGQAEDAREALRVIEREQPDLVLVDLSLKGTSGLELIKHLTDRPVKVLVVSMHDEATWSERALAAGALGYVHKSEATRDIVQAIRRVMTGRPYVSDSIAERILRKMVGTAVPEPSEDPVSALSDRELEIFQRIGEGKTTQEIGDSLCLSPKTVQTYRQRIKQKLGLENAAELSSQATRWVVERSER
ncbi:MAG: response regulator transcription factor [Acidobacteria bacterium]|nr:response regulator transcription factor [Acidobacteriota bacterium]